MVLEWIETSKISLSVFCVSKFHRLNMQIENTFDTKLTNMTKLTYQRHIERCFFVILIHWLTTITSLDIFKDPNDYLVFTLMVITSFSNWVRPYDIIKVYLHAKATPL
jgi:hypothetical protein